MSHETTLLLLHGVGGGDPDDAWKAVLSESLAGLGYPRLDAVHVVAPTYARLLNGVEEQEAVPGLTVGSPSGESARRNRRDFERRMGAMEIRLGRHHQGESFPGGDLVVDLAVKSPPFVQAHNYLHDQRIRAQVLRHVLGKVPDRGRLVLVGHSLGSVIAADLLRRLPVAVDVVGMVTIGSPLANANFDVDKLRNVLKDPPTNLGWWVNFWNGPDPVVANRGVSSVFPWMIDIRIRTGSVVDGHHAVQYLADTSVATAIGYALFGSTSTELAAIERGVEIPMDYAETVALMALRYAHLTGSKLEKDQQDRYAGALRRVQAATFERVRERNVRQDRPLPTSIARLRFDLSDVDAVAPEPDRITSISTEDAIVPLVTLLAANVIDPFEIAVPRNVRREALEDLTLEMGLGRQIARDAFAAVDDAHKVLTGGGINWVRWVALGLGAAALVLTGGLAIAAVPAGVAGAAAITSALAAFGPGGMLGGLLTAGTLVSVSTGGIAIGLASPTTSAETVEAVVSARLTAAILRKRRGLDQDPVIWAGLVETEIEVRRQYEQLDEFSDESSATLKDLKRKIEIIERAIEYLRANGLEPGVPAIGSDDA